MLTDKHCIAGLTRPCLDISIAEISKQKPHWHCGKLRGWFKYLILWYQQISNWYMSVREQSVMISPTRRSSKHAVEQYVGQWYWSIRYQLMVLGIRDRPSTESAGNRVNFWCFDLDSEQAITNMDVQTYITSEEKTESLRPNRSTCKTH